jgi:hypothetical protein
MVGSFDSTQAEESIVGQPQLIMEGNHHQSADPLQARSCPVDIEPGLHVEEIERSEIKEQAPSSEPYFLTSHHGLSLNHDIKQSWVAAKDWQPSKPHWTPRL